MSDIFFNKPEGDSRNFDPLIIKAQPGMTQEEHNNIVEAGKKMMGIKPSGPTSEQEFWDGIKSKMHQLRAKRDNIRNNAWVQGQVVNAPLVKVECARAIAPMALDLFCTYTKDELLLCIAVLLQEQLLDKE